MTEGFTGLNTAQAEADIRNFDSLCWLAHAHYITATQHLFATLSEKWASPKAVEFWEKYIGDILDLSSTFRTTYKHIVSGAVDAAKHLAIANGKAFSCDLNTIEPGATASAWGGHAPLKEEINGQVGMDVEGVKIALDTFSKEADKVITDIDGLPEGIAFYDPDGNMVGSYNRNIKDMKVNFTDLFDGIMASLTNAIQTESDNILLAKQKATDTMTA